jgi:hypothetical protein
MPCHAMHPIQDLFLKSFSYVLQFDMYFICTPMWTKFYSCTKWVLHSEALPQKGLSCTILMRAGLSSKLPSLTFIFGLVLTLLLDGAKKSLMHFRPAICAFSCGSGDPCNLSIISQMCDPDDPGEENLD